MEEETSSREHNSDDDCDFMDSFVSWSIEDILNENLLKHKVEKIELTFQSIGHYLGSFFNPLLEETRAQLRSSMQILYKAPYAEVISLMQNSVVNRLYKLEINGWKSRFDHHGESYKALPDDILVLADYKPENVEDLRRVGRMWSFVSVVSTRYKKYMDGTISVSLEVRASNDIDLAVSMNKTLFLVFLTNVSQNRRIWDAFHVPINLKVIGQILCSKDKVEECGICGSLADADALRDDSSYQKLLSELNESQNKAISACLSGLNCNHNSAVKLIWGPPGTGKTKTLATLLFALLRMKYRVLVCAPTNVAVKELATRVVTLVKEANSKEYGDLFCPMGELLLFGNNERLKVGEDIKDIYWDHRVQQLKECFSCSTGLIYCLQSMIYLLQNCASYYHRLEKGKTESKSSLEFLRERFRAIALLLRSRISNLCTHLPVSHFLEPNNHNLVCLNEALKSFEDLLFHKNFPSLGLETHFSWLVLHEKRAECLSALETIKNSLDPFMLSRYFIEVSDRKFCFETSRLIFSTVSGSHKLPSHMKPLNILVIDEAAQLKECESITPMLLPGISHALLVGDDCQLQSMVRSNVCYEAGFGRSLFQRLSSLDYPKYLLNVQYRMHPQISSFPNSYFYLNKIQDAQNVERNDYMKHYLPGPMFGPYSFINIIRGVEKFDDAVRSYKNMVEVAVVMIILKHLHKAWLNSKEKLSISIVSPYAGQVIAIQEKLGRMYDRNEGFNVNVKSVDGFQGGEHDVIILSTVRTNNRKSLEFVSSLQRTNVALTRARHCLWILGNERALTSNENVWKAIVLDAKSRKCFFSVDHEHQMEKAILYEKKETDAFDGFLDTHSGHFKNSLWQVHFSDKFFISFKRLQSKAIEKKVISLLKGLSRGFRPKRFIVDLMCENSSQILKQMKVEGLHVIFSIEIVKASRYIQALKIWDIVPIEDIPHLVKHHDNVFKSYTDEYISMCKCKGESSRGFVGSIEFPLSWPLSANITKFKNVYIEGSLCANEHTSDAETLCSG